MTTPPDDTIYALATPPGVGALAVLRLSGPEAHRVLATLSARPQAFVPRVATLTALIHPKTQETLDHALVTFFKGPGSFTGEDVAEISLHGGRAVVRGVLDVLAGFPGLRLAEPGAFTKRAFLNHKLDLTEAEAIADLIHAETVLQRRQALDQLSGSLKNLYDRWRDDLIHAAAYVEAHLDFPDEDLPDTLIDQIRPKIAHIQADISDHLNDQGRGEILRDGVRVVILGAPNVGKSSLLNALARRDVAIVSPVAGTTRDLIDVHLDLGGCPVILTDTAGLRRDELGSTEQDSVEKIGIDRALDRARTSPLKILLFDAMTIDAPDSDTLAQMDDRSIVVANKIDQATSPPPKTLNGRPVYPLSVQTGQGLDALIQTLGDRAIELTTGHEGAVLSRARHRSALTDCATALADSRAETAPELVAEHLRAAISALSRLTGRVDVEDLLDVIFHDFCIGK